MTLALAVAVAGASAPAGAGAQALKPIADARVRYENADQEGFDEEAQALTFRLRAGAELAAGDWALLAESEGTAALTERYDSGLNRKTHLPLVGDPENIELNRLQLQYRGLTKGIVTLGRQRINIQDQRFVGSVGWRQNEQTFDALRFEYGDAKGIKVDLAYSWSVRTIWGIDGSAARQQAIGGNNVFATVSHPTPVGTLSGFAFVIDQDEADVQGVRLSSKTYGLRLAGAHNLSPQTRLNYSLSYANQSDHHRNPNDYQADYWLTELGIELWSARLGVGHERLGADEGTTLTSFQTPLATLHKFQGWADKFTTTPPNGIRDTYASVAYACNKLFGLDAISATVIYHNFESDRRKNQYGDEWDAQLTLKKGRWAATAKLADYDAEQFATDTRKIWLQLEWAY